jgi:hypothetical protein
VFFGLAALNLRVDSCMFETRFLMFAESRALGISLLFFWNHFDTRGSDTALTCNERKREDALVMFCLCARAGVCY